MFITGRKLSGELAKYKISVKEGGRGNEVVNCQHLETQQLEEEQTKKGIRPTATTNIFFLLFFSLFKKDV